MYLPVVFWEDDVPGKMMFPETLCLCLDLLRVGSIMYRLLIPTHSLAHKHNTHTNLRTHALTHTPHTTHTHSKSRQR